MKTLKYKYFYTFGIFLLLLDFSYAAKSTSQHNVPANINTLVNKGKQKSAITLINQIIKKKEGHLSRTKKTNVSIYTSLYDDISELMILKNELLLKLGKADDIDRDHVCNFVLDYEEVEFIKTQFYKTPFHDDIAKTVENVASLYELCHPPMAKKYLKSVLKIKENIYGKESIKAAETYDALGDYERIYMANFTEAIKHYEKANKIREKLYGADDPRITKNYKWLSTSIYYHGDKNKRAETLLLRSIELRKKAPKNKEFPLYAAYMDMGIYYSMKDEYNKSIDYLQKALKSFQGKVNKNYIVIISELSQNYLNQNDLSNALKYADEAYRVSKAFYGSDAHYQVLENSLRLTEINNRMNQKNTKWNK